MVRLSWRSGLNRMLKWRFRKLPPRISQEPGESLDDALERLVTQCMDKVSDLPDPLDVEVSAEAVHCTVEENALKDRVEVARRYQYSKWIPEPGHDG